jgi:hypothetical protein
MESFDIGSHVLIELDDTRRVAGYIVSVADEGFVLKVTHKDLPAVHTISERLGAKIRDELDAVPMVFLAASLISRRMYASVGKKGRMVEALAEMEEADLIARTSEAKPLTFHELSVPVLTFVNGGAILMMESSDDVLEDMEVMKFNESVDSDLEELLSKPVVAETPSE